MGLLNPYEWSAEKYITSEKFAIRWELSRRT
jgi:hypothetical protein